MAAIRSGCTCGAIIDITFGTGLESIEWFVKQFTEWTKAHQACLSKEAEGEPEAESRTGGDAR